MELLQVYDVIVQNRQGDWMSVWTVYQGPHVITVEFTKDSHGFTDRVTL